MKEENTIKPVSGWIMLPVMLLMLAAIIYMSVYLKQPGWLFLTLLPLIASIGFFIINPNESSVLVLFGKYQGTVRTDGFFWSIHSTREEKSLSGPTISIMNLLR